MNRVLDFSNFPLEMIPTAQVYTCRYTRHSHGNSWSGSFSEEANSIQSPRPAEMPRRWNQVSSPPPCHVKTFELTASHGWGIKRSIWATRWPWATAADKVLALPVELQRTNLPQLFAGPSAIPGINSEGCWEWALHYPALLLDGITKTATWVSLTLLISEMSFPSRGM